MKKNRKATLIKRRKSNSDFSISPTQIWNTSATLMHIAHGVECRSRIVTDQRTERLLKKISALIQDYVYGKGGAESVFQAVAIARMVNTATSMYQVFKANKSLSRLEALRSCMRVTVKLWIYWIPEKKRKNAESLLVGPLEQLENDFEEFRGPQGVAFHRVGKLFDVSGDWVRRIHRDYRNLSIDDVVGTFNPNREFYRAILKNIFLIPESQLDKEIDKFSRYLP